MRRTLTLVALLSCGTPAGADWLTGDCKADHEEIERRLDALADAHRTPCTTAADCVAVEAKVSCQGGHAHALSSSALAAWELDRQAFEASACPYVANTCSVIGDGAQGVLACESGACTLK